MGETDNVFIQSSIVSCGENYKDLRFPLHMFPPKWQENGLVSVLQISRSHYLRHGALQIDLCSWLARSAGAPHQLLWMPSQGCQGR